MMRKNLWIASGVAVVVVMAGLLVYGSYISARYQMEALQTATHEQWMQLDGAIQRWADTMPQVAAAVEPVAFVAKQSQMAQQNQIALDTLTRAQQTVLRADHPQAVIAASRGLEQVLDGVMAMAASRPDLEKDAKFQDLQQRLHRRQVRVEQDRARYNESLRNYNLFVGDFPNSIWAKIAGFGPGHNFFPKLAGNS